MAFLDNQGLSYFWQKMKGKFLPISGGEIQGKLSVMGSIDVAGDIRCDGTIQGKQIYSLSTNNVGTIVTGEAVVFIGSSGTMKAIGLFEDNLYLQDGSGEYSSIIIKRATTSNEATTLGQVNEIIKEDKITNEEIDEILSN